MLFMLTFLSLSYRYKAIVKYKTAFYSFYLPVAAAMYMVRVCLYCKLEHVTVGTDGHHDGDNTERLIAGTILAGKIKYTLSLK